MHQKFLPLFLSLALFISGAVAPTTANAQAVDSLLTAVTPKQLTTRIVSILDADTVTDPVRLLVEADGWVLKITPTTEQLATLRDAVRFQQTVDFELSERREVIRFTISPTKNIPALDPLFLEPALDPETLDNVYQPTVLTTHEEVETTFFNQRRNLKKRSQCYQRAHVWTHEMWRSRSIKSQKVFLFFTRKYIQEYDYGWWFHVSPFVLAQGGQSGISEWVMDRTFTDKPLLMKDWTDVFMENGANCPVVAKYQDYSEHQQDSYCYLRKVPMYYYQPLDIEKLDTAGAVVPSWEDWSIEHAYRAVRGL